MFNNIFSKYNYDNLYLGVVTIYRSKYIKPNCLKVEVPEAKEKISYLTILNKVDNKTYLQIDNEQFCFVNDSKNYSNYPIVGTVIPLKKYCEKSYGLKSKFFSIFFNKKLGEKIINDATNGDKKIVKLK